MTTYAQRKAWELSGNVAYRQRRLSLDERAAIERMLPTFRDTEIAEHFGVTASTIRCYRKRLGVSEPFPSCQEHVDPLPDSLAGRMAKRLGYATVDPAAADLGAAYEAGQRARLRHEKESACPFINEHAVFWRAGFNSRPL